MFYFGSTRNINPELSKYIREHTNKSMEKYSKMTKCNLVTTCDQKVPCWYNIIPFVSVVSFLAGYNFCYYTRK